MRPDKLDISRACVLVVDMQEKLLSAIDRGAQAVASCIQLLDGAHVFHIPVIATEQYPQGIGPTTHEVTAALDRCAARMIEKPTFSAWAHEPVREAMLSIDRPQVIVTGIETHVCVQQTVLDLLSRDYDVYLCADAVGSRGRLDYDTAIRRMSLAGAHVTTVESVLFELCHRCDTPPFKGLLDVIKSVPPRNE